MVYGKRGMTPIFRRSGWLLMALALGVAVAARWGGVSHYGPIPAVVVAMLVGGAGVLLVVTDRMVRVLYAQVGAAARHDRAPAQTGALAESDALASQGSGLRRSAAGNSETVAAGDATVGGDGDDVAVGGDLDRA